MSQTQDWTPIRGQHSAPIDTTRRGVPWRHRQIPHPRRNPDRHDYGRRKDNSFIYQGTV